MTSKNHLPLESFSLTLSFISTDIYNKDKDAKLDLLEEIRRIAVDSSQLFRIYSIIGGIKKHSDKQRALSIFEKAYTYIEGESLQHTQAAFHREYSRFLLTQG